jgi:enediyne biosynthesis protein E7
MTSHVEVAVVRERWAQRGPIRMLEEVCDSGHDVVDVRFNGDKPYLTVINNRSIALDILKRPESELTKESDLGEAMEALLGEGLLTASGDSWAQQRRDCLSDLGTLSARGSDWEALVEHTVSAVDSTICSDGTGDVFGDLKGILFGAFVRHVLQSDAQVDAKVFTIATDALLDAGRDPEFVMLDASRPRSSQVETSEAIDILSAMSRDILGSARPSATWLAGLAGQAENVQRQRLTTLLLSGHETTALTVAWLLLQTARDEGQQEMMRRPGAVGHFVSESLRLNPPVYALGRVASCALEIEGHRVESGTNLLISVWTIHRRPDIFRDPLEFRPSRWEAITNPSSKLLTFGGGVRRCMGEVYATRLASRIVDHIVSKYQYFGGDLDGVEPIGYLTVRPSRPFGLTFQRLQSKSRAF